MIKDVIFPDSRNYNVIVVGAGFVGLPLSYALASLGLKVALIEKSVLKKKSLDGRIFAFSLDTKNWLEELYPDCSWGWGSFSKIKMGFDQKDASFSFFQNENPSSEHRMRLGHTLSASALWNGMASVHHPFIDLFEESKIVQCLSCKKQAELIIRQKDQQIVLRAPLLLAADGLHSQIRSIFHPSEHTFDFGQRAFSFKIQHPSHDVNETAYEIFFPQGSAALLPVSQTESAVIWIESSDQRSQHDIEYSKEEVAQDILWKTKEVLKKELPWIMEKEVELASPLVSHPLIQKKIFQTAFPNVLLVGDAAHAVHPIAGQGLNLALREIKMLLTHLKRYQSLGLDWGSSVFLKKIQKQQLAEANRLMGMTFLLVYGLSFEKIPGLWQMICFTMNHLPRLNRWFLQKASGSHHKSETHL